jgi:hypothetical protein
MTTKSIATAAATAALAITILAGCSSVQQPITADPTDATPTAAGSETVKPVKKTTDGRADVCSGIDAQAFDLPDNLAEAFTKQEVASANCEALRFQVEAGWTNLANPQDESVKVSKGQAIVEVLRPWMSARALEQVEALAVAAARGDGDAESSLMGLTAVNLTNGDWLLRAEVADAPIVGDRRWSATKVNLDEKPDAAGRERVDITVTFTDELLLARKSDRAPGRVDIQRTVTYAMSQTGLGDHPWVVDAWTVAWKPAGKPALVKGAEK